MLDGLVRPMPLARGSEGTGECLCLPDAGWVQMLGAICRGNEQSRAHTLALGIVLPGDGGEITILQWGETEARGVLGACLGSHSKNMVELRVGPGSQSPAAIITPLSWWGG